MGAVVRSVILIPAILRVGEPGLGLDMALHRPSVQRVGQRARQATGSSGVHSFASQYNTTTHTPPPMSLCVSVSLVAVATRKNISKFWKSALP